MFCICLDDGVPSAADEKFISIHCVVERIIDGDCKPGVAPPTVIDKETDVALPASTPFRNVVHQALRTMGYTESKIIGAKGFFTMIIF